GLARFRIDDLGVEMVFPDDRTVFGFDTFTGHARPHDFGQPVNIDRVDCRFGLDVLAHLPRPWFGAEDPDTQRTLTPADPLAPLLFQDIAEIRGRDHDDVRTKIIDQLHLLFRLAARHRNHRAPQPLGPVMGPKPAGEQPITIGYVDDIARFPAGGANRAC